MCRTSLASKEATTVPLPKGQIALANRRSAATLAPPGHIREPATASNPTFCPELVQFKASFGRRYQVVPPEICLPQVLACLCFGRSCIVCLCRVLSLAHVKGISGTSATAAVHRAHGQCGPLVACHGRCLHYP